MKTCMIVVAVAASFLTAACDRPKPMEGRKPWTQDEVGYCQAQVAKTEWARKGMAELAVRACLEQKFGYAHPAPRP